MISGAYALIIVSGKSVHIEVRHALWYCNFETVLKLVGEDTNGEIIKP